MIIFIKGFEKEVEKLTFFKNLQTNRKLQVNFYDKMQKFLKINFKKVFLLKNEIEDLENYIDELKKLLGKCSLINSLS